MNGYIFITFEINAASEKKVIIAHLLQINGIKLRIG